VADTVAGRPRSPTTRAIFGRDQPLAVDAASVEEETILKDKIDALEKAYNNANNAKAAADQALAQKDRRLKWMTVLRMGSERWPTVWMHRPFSSARRPPIQ